MYIIMVVDKTLHYIHALNHLLSKKISSSLCPNHSARSPTAKWLLDALSDTHQNILYAACKTIHLNFNIAIILISQLLIKCLLHLTVLLILVTVHLKGVQEWLVTKLYISQVHKCVCALTLSHQHQSPPVHQKLCSVIQWEKMYQSKMVRWQSETLWEKRWIGASVVYTAWSGPSCAHS